MLGQINSGADVNSSFVYKVNIQSIVGSDFIGRLAQLVQSVRLTPK